MKTITFIFILITLTIGFINGDTVPQVKNPAKPAKSDTGRTVELEPLLTISDEDGEFFFKRPNRIKVAEDGSIFMVDKDQLLRFDSNGKFLKNLHTNGEGPGEFVWLRNFFPTSDQVRRPGNRVIIYTGQPAKVIQMDFQGTLIKETRLKSTMGFHRLLAFDDNKFWSGGATPPDFSKVKTGAFTVDRQLWQETMDGEATKTGIMFPEVAYMEKTVGKSGALRLRMTISIPAVYAIDKKDLYVCNSRTYKIRRIDLLHSKPKEVVSFSRPYKSRACAKREDEEGSRTIGPSPALFNDVQKIRLFKDRVWVFTSTVDKQKGVLVDVFSRDGKYLDYFYLRLPQVETVHDLNSAEVSIHQEFIFMVQKDDEDNAIVVKYKLK